jgi:HEAT repeat protein
MSASRWVRLAVGLGAALSVGGSGAGRASAGDPALDRAVDALIQVLGDPKAADGDRVEETRRAVRALVAIGQPAVPKLIDAALGTNQNASLYAGLALKEMSQNDTRDPVRERWDRLGAADRWRLARYVTDVHFNAVADFAVESLKHKDEAIRIPAWEFITRHRGAQRLAPARELFFKALAGGESPKVRWHLLTEEPVFDRDQEADVLIGLLRPDSWAARGDGRIPPPGATPPWWPDGRDLVIPILGKRKVQRAAPALVNVLAEKGPGRGYLGHLILPILGDLGDKEAVPELKRVLDTPSDKHEPTLWGRDYLHALAAAALLQLGDPAGRARGKELLGSREALAGGTAALAFARYGTKEDLDVLAKLLDHESWQVRRDVCRGLERITGVVNRPPGWSVTTEDAAPLWKDWLRKNRKE